MVDEVLGGRRISSSRQRQKNNNELPSSSSSARYESFATFGEIRVWWRADFQSVSRVLKKVF